MKNAITVLSILGLLACMTSEASAQDGAKKRGHKREAILKKFDKDGDGKLSKEEKAAAREFRDSKRKDGDKKPALRRKIAKRFDKDGDHKLNDAERESLKKFLDSKHRGDRQKRVK